MRQIKQRTTQKPYEMVGAGRLVSAVWKTGDEESGWHYRFNVYRMTSSSGRVSQLFQPRDVPDLVKLCQVLATVLTDDGCLPGRQRRELAELADRLDQVTNTRSR